MRACVVNLGKLYDKLELVRRTNSQLGEVELLVAREKKQTLGFAFLV